MRRSVMLLRLYTLVYNVDQKWLMKRLKGPVFVFCNVLLRTGK